MKVTIWTSEGRRELVRFFEATSLAQKRGDKATVSQSQVSLSRQQLNHPIWDSKTAEAFIAHYEALDSLDPGNSILRAIQDMDVARVRVGGDYFWVDHVSKGKIAVIKSGTRYISCDSIDEFSLEPPSRPAIEVEDPEGVESLDL